jgi:hypothetical protein
MRILVWSLCLLCAVGASAVAPGCSAVTLNAEYSRILDETAALSATTADRAEAGRLDPNCMKQALRWNARCWRLFQDARDGLESSCGPEGCR